MRTLGASLDTLWARVARGSGRHYWASRHRRGLFRLESRLDNRHRLGKENA